MRIVRTVALTMASLLAAAFILGPASSGQDNIEPPKEKKGGFKARTWEEINDAGVGYLKTSQADDGSWSKTIHPGVTGVVLIGLFDWRADITRAPANRQRADGSWGSDFKTWMEGNSNLDTAYALIALSYTKPKTK